MNLNYCIKNQLPLWCTFLKAVCSFLIAHIFTEESEVHRPTSITKK